MDNKQEKTYAGMTRRTLCLGAGGAAVMLGLGGLKYAGSQPLVRPPGGQDEERLISAYWCDWCAEEHDGTPLCVSACPTEALKLPDDATAENTIIGKAVINTDWCLAYKLIGCRFCYDACPYEAMELDENNRPVVIEDKCNGCGACESVCVSLQNGSISEGATARAIVVHPLDEVEG